MGNWKMLSTPTKGVRRADLDFLDSYFDRCQSDCVYIELSNLDNFNFIIFYNFIMI